MPQLVNQVLRERYRIQSLLGRQTGRRTFLATDLQTGLSVVIKLLLFGPEFSWEDLKLFEREVEVLKYLDHPAIPKYLDCFEIETELFIETLNLAIFCWAIAMVIAWDRFI